MSSTDMTRNRNAGRGSRPHDSGVTACAAGGLILLLLSAGCAARVPADDAAADGRDSSDASPDGPGALKSADILFVVDNTESMRMLHGSLAEHAHVLFEELAFPTPTSVSGPTPRAVEQLHAGVATTDMGTAGFDLRVFGCDEPDAGDGGALWSGLAYPPDCPTINAPDCTDGDCPWLSFDSGSGSRTLWEEFECIESLGTGGCPFEQPLEAARAALTARTEPGEPNQGFVRSRSVLAVVFVTDEDDCSAADGEIYDVANEALGALDLRCAVHSDMLRPVEVYYDELARLRDMFDGALVVAGIIGLPVDGSWEVGDPIEALAALQRPDETSPNTLASICEADMHTPYTHVEPGVRLAELISMFGEDGFMASICEEDWTETMMGLARAIQRHLR